MAKSGSGSGFSLPGSGPGRHFLFPGPGLKPGFFHPGPGPGSTRKNAGSRIPGFEPGSIIKFQFSLSLLVIEPKHN